MHRIKLTISYNGAGFYGWQLQATTEHSKQKHKKQRSVQGELEAVVSKLVDKKIRLHGAGRTDAGVHAEGQVAHFDDDSKTQSFDWKTTLNRLLPQDIRIVEATLVSSEFHSRFDAVAKSYFYNLWLDQTYTPPFLAPFVWTTGTLNLSAMQEAATYLLGQHDFSCFQNQGSNVSDSTRTLYLVEPNNICTSLSELELATISDKDLCSAKLQSWHFKGDGFLKQMVRNIMGLLWAVGKEKISPLEVVDILNSKDRKQSAKTAPAHALFLHKVYY
ncbi:tRNA pseudouridine(38-40) synthase TruA [Desulfovibrio litoralis]|uniref:tRNA pseudouridine synthase A n=1 Tax=Desulfovibrio litoralis DSM 11393 TaxID=1121455 RepID=A0A1M7TD83_9BACT|nr:tRNA pseudouridine(38-40) synthase TruA [Desulfovibrio litoralis]SHN68675.1 tRNA pseudouridine38-40 synthase [Desulfovibrio litoralis DSM 11393]